MTNEEKKSTLMRLCEEPSYDFKFFEASFFLLCENIT